MFAEGGYLIDAKCVSIHRSLQDLGVHGHNGDNDSEQTQSTAEDLNNKHFHERSLLLGIEDSSVGSDGSNADAGSDVGEGNHVSGSKDLVTLLLRVGPAFPVLIGTIGCLVNAKVFRFVRKQDGHNDTVDGASFAEDY